MGHKRPIEPSPSKALTEFSEALVRLGQGHPILDVACGYGRNAAHIAAYGVNVVCIDNDPLALRHIMTLPDAHRLTTVQMDVVNDAWPFDLQSVGAMVNVHYYHPALLDRFIELLRSGGCLYLETPGGQGENFRELPPRGYIRERLVGSFDLRHYEETRVGRESNGAVSVKLFAVKV